MKPIFILLILFITSFLGFSQTNDSKILKYHSKMGMIQNVEDRTDTKMVKDAYLLIFDFEKKTVVVEPDQFRLDMVRLIKDTETEKNNTTNILCIDENNKKCTVSVSYIKGTEKIIINILFQNLDYVYFIQ